MIEANGPDTIIDSNGHEVELNANRIWGSSALSQRFWSWHC